MYIYIYTHNLVVIVHLFPHICVWGSCFWFCIPSRLRPAAAFAPCPTPPSFTQLCHNAQLCHTPSHTQAWHLGTFTFVLRGTWRHRPSFRVAGVALMALGWLFGRAVHLRFAWQAWHLRHWAGSGVALGHRLGAAGLVDKTHPSWGFNTRVVQH